MNISMRVLDVKFISRTCPMQRLFYFVFGRHYREHLTMFFFL
jgi:hypothetical protein